MRSSYTITLFSRPPQRERAPSAFVVSIVLHSCLFAVLFASMRRVTVVDHRLPNRNYTVRLLDIRQAKSSIQWIPQNNFQHHSQMARRHSISAGGKLGVARVSRIARISRNFESQKPALHTMIQPEVPPDMRIPDIPIPQAMVWTAGKITQRKVVTPAPQPVGAIQAKPSLKMPNRELNPAEISLSSTPFETKAPMPFPGTTTPVDVNAAKPAQQLPETASKEVGQISPARVISVSDLKLEEGTAALPMINEVAQADTSGSPMPGQTGGTSHGGDDATDSQQNGSGAGHGASRAGDNDDGVTVQDGTITGSDQGFSVDNGSDGNPSSGTSTSAPEHITLPKNGQYGMVVVGASPEQNYPETANLWTGRIVYTVYLQTDTAQNWILQYSLPRSGGNTLDDGSRPDPPWPYDLMRPNLGSYRDIVLVHGFVSAVGKFERLSVDYPPGFAEADLLLRALKQWEFRPAMDRGRPVTVEVLLIVPGEAD
jgi:hypothetical protein